MRNQLKKYSALVFMINIWLAGNIEIIAEQEALKTRLLLEKIYEKFKEATSNDLNFKAKACFEI